ncbi:MAG TPA: hypothetical protein VNM87_00285 [Candidatus Udaeobacter sp.]|nr:hypothetical protein [Candidatus Udaeobacter sp.]
MASLSGFIVAAHHRLGLTAPDGPAWQPRSPLVRSALDALRNDDLERAVAELGRAWLADPGEEAVVAREVIVLRFDAESRQIESRIADARKLKGTALGEVSLLELRLRRLRFVYAPQLVWITVASAILIATTTAVSIRRYGMNPWVGALGGLAFMAAAVLLLRDDFRRQRGAFAGRRAQLAAEVAEEIQILHAEVRSRDAELKTLERAQQRIAACQEQLPSPI